MDRKTKSLKINGQEIIFETGRLARQANGAVMVSMGETIVFAAACAAKEPSPTVDFLPLSVHYVERFSSAGRTLGGFIKREGKPSEKETLTSRLIDRPLRPLFPEGYFTEVQVIANCLSYDGIHPPEVLGLLAASAALVISDIPLIKPVGGVRVGMVDGKFVINPTVAEQEKSVLDLLIAGTEDAVLMIEGYCDFLTEEQVLEAIDAGHSAIRTICHALTEWSKEVGKEKNTSQIQEIPEALLKEVRHEIEAPIKKTLALTDKGEREKAESSAKEKLLEKLCPADAEKPLYEPKLVKRAWKSVHSHIMRDMVLNTGKRADGRGTKDIRKITIDQSILPRTHGSSLFTRGETQALAVCTLGGENMAQRGENLHGELRSRFYLQYSFPPFSVGEVGRMGPPGRREVGHGKLAERAIAAALPSREEFPYIIRLESNILESNGSSSMASICGGCLALMDGGVPIKRPIAGIAMGLILEKDKYVILSDILGLEDALGDMDFKIAGDKSGITAFQMDIKVEGITIDIMRAALAQAREGRMHILEIMHKACPHANSKLSQYAPKIEILRVKPSKIAIIIGPGGKQIRAIIEETGVEIDIDDTGIVTLTSSDEQGIEKAKSIIIGLTSDIEIGKIYHGKITSVVAFGVFVELLPGKEGLCHISEADNERINDIFKVFKQGDEITVKVLDINDRGQVKLSRKAALV